MHKVIVLNKPVFHTKYILFPFQITYYRKMDFKIASTAMLFMTTVLVNNVIVSADGYYLYLTSDSDGFYSLDKGVYNAYCQRCMTSENDWYSCSKCFESERKVKRGKASFINYGYNKNCYCCQKATFNLLCCLNCSPK